MLGYVAMAMLVAGAFLPPIAGQATPTQQRSVSPAQATAEEPWPPPGVVRPGTGVVSPRLIRESKPSYTPEAMQAKINGVVVLEAVVDTDGTVSKVRVKRSLDRRYGLDDEAVRTLKRWKFAPGQQGGVAVPVLVEVEMSFALRK